ncbi:MAG TPA: hypothetical protein VGN37_27710 [Actinocatenispora sp.]
MTILAVVVTVLLLVESLPSAIAGLLRSTAFLTRLDQLTRAGTLQGRLPWLPRTLGALHTVGTAGAVAGIWIPWLGVAGGGLEAAIFGWTLWRQLRAGDRGRALGAYLLFLGMALLVVVVDVLRL